jgi:hypothetical protein
VPLHIGTVEAAEAQPYYPALLVERELPSFDDPWAAGAFPGILPQCLQLLLHVVGLEERQGLLEITLAAGLLLVGELPLLRMALLELIRLFKFVSSPLPDIAHALVELRLVMLIFIIWKLRATK